MVRYARRVADDPALDVFSAPVRQWFASSFEAPTEAQRRGWAAISSGANALVLAPTGSGKTLTAFLWGIDRLMTEAGRAPGGEASSIGSTAPRRTRIVYLSPLRALAVDVQKNLRAPLRGIAHAAARNGTTLYEPTVGVRTGDTSPQDRRRLQRSAPDLLITTPESLYLMLTSAARQTLVDVEAVIVDEIHALVPTKRGAHLAVSLERLEHLCGRPFQRIGLSATQRPLDEVARFLGGVDPATRKARPVEVVDAGSRKTLELEVVVPVEDMGALGEVISEPVSGPAAGGPARRSIWPSLHPVLLDRVQAHRSTIVFTNARRAAERLAARLNELDVERRLLAGERGGSTDDADGNGHEGPRKVGSYLAGENQASGLLLADGEEPDLVRAHHGSLSRERRLAVEDQLKRGELRGLVATSSLELGIDMGAVDLVCQVGSPGSVAAGVQRVGRAGHQVGEPSRGVLFPRHRADLLETATITRRMHEGLVESIRYQRNPLDVAAQHIVAMCALDEWDVTELAAVLRSAAPFAELSDQALEAVLELLAGRYPAEDFTGLHARVVWDRLEGRIRGRRGSQRLAVTNAGTIPDRGLFGVFLADGTRVGELDEEMVYESRPGETFLLGASTWRIEDITFDRVVVSPAPGEPARMPFWRGDAPGRPVELGRAVGALVAELRRLDADAAAELLGRHHDLDEWAARNLVAFLDEQAEATGAVPDDQTIVVERFRDEIGDWRVCILTTFGDRVHAPWAVALRARLAERWGDPPELLHSDHGIVLRLPEHIDELPLDDLLIDPEDIDDLVLEHLPSTALFAARFRECAARALLLPRRRPDRRTPMWQQRQRAADLLSVAAAHPQFPIMLEAVRECCTEVFDLDALRSLCADVRSRQVRVVTASTDHASPFAQSLLFEWIAVFMYEGDAPLAERRAAALVLDRELLGDLLGTEQLRDLLDPEVIDELVAWLARTAPTRRARDLDDVHDALMELGPLDRAGLEARVDPSVVPDAWWTTPSPAVVGDEARFVRVSLAGVECLAAAEDAGRLRDALGVAVPVGLPTGFTDSVDDPLGDLVRRWARVCGPFTADEMAVRWGAPVARVLDVLADAERVGRLVRGAFRPGGVGDEWCDPDALRQLRRRSLAALRREIQPVEAASFSRFTLEWHGIGAARRGIEAVADVVAQLGGAALPASDLERDVLAARVADYRPSDLDTLCATGEVVWIGAGAIGSSDGRVRLALAEQLPYLVPAGNEPTIDASPVGGSPDEGSPDDGAPGAEPDSAATRRAVADAVRRHLSERGASRWSELQVAVQTSGLPYDDDLVLVALWDLVWAGEVTNDALAPLRAYVGAGRSSGRRRASLAPTSTVPARRPSSGRPSSRSGGARRRGRAPLGSLRSGGPAAGSGRWSLVAAPGPAPDPTERALADASMLLERHGVLTREAVRAEGLAGGFAGLYPVLRALEDRGQVRRGYFVEGLGGAQFAYPGVVDRLRAVRDEPTAGGSAARAVSGPDDDDAAGGVVVLAADDPAQLFGATLPWPTSSGRPGRAAGALVVLADGEPCAFVERGGRSLLTFPAADRRAHWVHGLVALLDAGRRSRLAIGRIDGEPAAESPWASALAEVGFADGYRGLVARASR
ncbi:MAG: DEAD/DEAH box helicase [Acidimicrobiia bacterium]|nr:DEAD/DEAH box helicase [Acidimicrobiia bacterium]